MKLKLKPERADYLGLTNNAGRAFVLPHDTSPDVRRRISPRVLRGLEPAALLRMATRRGFALATMRADAAAVLYGGES
jgi:hypothetical protein